MLSLQGVSQLIRQISITYTLIIKKYNNKSPTEIELKPEFQKKVEK